MGGRTREPTLLEAPPADRRWLTAEEAAGYVRVSLRTFQGWVSRQAVPVVRLPGRRILFDREALDSWLASRTTSPRASLENVVAAHYPVVRMGRPVRRRRPSR